ncbi:hypothetical protein V2J09_018711 [Rumex salicifolius]
MASFPGRLVSIVLLLMAIPYLAHSEPTQDKQALQDFINKVPHANHIQWNSSDSACNWHGVHCDSSRSYVAELRLPGAGLLGQIPDGTLGRLSSLRVLSLRDNGLYGSLPADFSNLTLLRSLYIHRNQLSGEFPAGLTQLSGLSRLDLSSNNFSGSIPFSLNSLTQLAVLHLQDNGFSGTLPSIDGGSLNDFNVSNNKLNGSIPKSLTRFPESSFRGNLQLCGSPLPACNSSFFPPPASPPSATTSVVPSSPAERSHKKLSTGAIVAIAIAAAVVFLILLLLLFFCCFRRRRGQTPKSPIPATATSRAVGAAALAGEAGTSSSKDDLTTSSAVEAERNKLVFVNAAGAVAYSFDLEDLLRASAEVLGKGSVGTSYKAVLEEGTTVVVKRLKDVVAAKREFEMQMEVLGNCRHENVVPLRAYYFSKDEKLLVSDYFASGSLSSLLHGSRGSGKTPLDWDSRMKIAVATARGLSYLHVSGKVVHGNIKSSNVLLRPDQREAAVSDYGLNPLFGNSGPTNRMAGYRAPEVVETRRVSFKSDVYSFVREEWTAEVFDVELMRYNNIEEEMVQLLQIAMACVYTVPDQRPEMPEVLRMMDEINRGDADGGLRQSSDDPSKGSDGQTPPMERTPESSVTP